MAKASWCTVAPTSGTGSKAIAISATAHTGRVARSTTVTVQNQNGTKPSKEVTVNQAGAALFITKTAGPTPTSITAAGGVITVTGKSNAKMIVLFESSDFMSVNELKVNGVAQTDSNNDPTYPHFIITGDVGAGSEYTFESKVTIPPNPDARARPVEICYKACLEDGNDQNTPSFLINLSQAAALSSLSIDKSSLSLVSGGTAQNIAVTSNDNWVVS